MAVIKAPRRQQDYLTEYDRQMAQYLRQMGGSIGAQDIAAEAYGGKFPVGTMTAKILSGVLARASDKRAMNREERAKDSYSRAFEIANAQDRGLNAMPGELGVDQSGNLDLLPTTALQTTDGVTNRQPYVFDDSPVDTSYNFAPNNEEMATRERIANQRAEAFANASPEAPLGVPYARQDVALTVGEPTGEDTTRIGRYLSGTLEQDILPTNANKALSQALRGANVPEFEFDEYRQNKRIQDRTLELAEQERKRNLLPQFKTQKTYYTSKGDPTVVNMFLDPTTGLPMYRGAINETVDILNLSPNKPDLGENIAYTLTNDQRIEANNLGFNFPSNATVKFQFIKGFNPEGKSLTELIANTTSQDWKQPLKDNITKIYTGKIPQTTLDKLSDTVTNSFGELMSGASLINSLKDIPITGGYGQFVEKATGVGAFLDGFTGNSLDLENRLTKVLADVDAEKLSALRTEMQLYLASSIEAITGEESGRYTEAEQRIAREALASKDIWSGSPSKAYGAIMQIMSIQELARDRAEIQLAYEEAKQNNTEFVDPFPYTRQNLKIYTERLTKLGLDAKTIKKVIKQSMAGREEMDFRYRRNR